VAISTLSQYLQKRGIKGPWKLEPQPNHFFENIVVIPVLAEFDRIQTTLKSLDDCEEIHSRNTLVIVVVNNSSSTKDEYIANNLKTLKYFASKPQFNFSLSIIDASSENVEIPLKHAGVGMARKIGMDLALSHANPDTLLFCLDGDTTVSTDYFSYVNTFFENHGSNAAVVGFSHSKNDIVQLEKNIRLYEDFLYYTAQKLDEVGSPYGYVAMGSAMVCRADAYAAIGGMPRKKATEDFYFLQELAKFRRVDSIPKKLVFPSSRLSDRVYLGTGFRMNQVEQGSTLENLFFPQYAFDVIGIFLKKVTSNTQIDGEKIFDDLKNIDELLYEFLLEENFVDVWDKIQKVSPTKSHFIFQFHRWFDALKTYRLLNRYLKYVQSFEIK
jgi:hypothetical protein